MKARSIVSACALAAGLLLVVGGPALATVSRLTIHDNYYTPNDLRVETGVTVTWENGGANAHTVSADDGTFDSGQLTTGRSYTHTFTKPGTYFYYCKNVGLAMSGVVEVLGNAPSPQPSGGDDPSAQGGTSGLAATGAELIPFVWLGLGFLLTGAFALVRLRRTP